MQEKIGLGIVSYKRESYLKQTLPYVPTDKLSSFVIVNDGTPYNKTTYGDVPFVIQNEKNLGVSASKNKALQYLLDAGCGHIFLMEDDIFIKNPDVFDAYIKASKETKIQHFNYALHGFANKTHSNQALPKSIIDIKNTRISLYENCVGAFSYYSRKCLDTVGLIDENFYNAFDHVDHTYQIIQNKMHPDFWWFADICNSDQYLSDIEWSKETSTISSRKDHTEIMKDALQYFEEKNGISIFSIPKHSIGHVAETLKEIYKNG